MTSVDKYARRLSRVESGLRAVATQPRLARSSIDGGALEIRDNATGETTGIIGQQFDGTTSAAVVGGTFPVAPTMPMVTEIVGGLRIYWDGTYADGSPTRMDFRRVTFHAVTDTDDIDILDPAQIVGEVTIATGGEVTVGLPYVEHFVCAVVWTEAGKFSVESDFAYGTPQFVNSGDLDPSIDLGGAGSDGNPPATAPVVTGTAGFQSVHLTWPEVTNADRVFYEIAISDTDGFTPTVGDVEGNITGTMANIVTSYTTAYVKVRALDVDGPGPWSSQVTVIPKQGLDQAALDAALEGVDDDLAVVAGNLATVASDLDTAEATLATVGSDLDAAEATLATAQGDITTALANAAAANTAAGNAQTTANGAVTLANGKNKVSFSTSTPGTTANTAGDTWFRLDGSGNVIAVYSGTGGTSWVQRAVDGTAIVADSITATQIAANAITTNELNALAVTAAKIAANTITAAQIAADTITAAEIAANAITVNELAANAVTAAKIVALTITGDKIAANTITAGKLVADTITSNEIAADTITANEIAANTITGDEIAANTITAENIAADTITANEIDSAYVYTGSLEANQIQTGDLAATLAILGEIKTSTSGRNISISSANGLVARDPSGDIVAQIPTSLVQDISMQADLVAKSVTALGSVAMRASNNELAQAATLTLRGATAAPVTPPTVSIDWTQISASINTSSFGRGANYDAGSDRIYRAYSVWGYSGVQWINPNTGALIGSLVVGDPDSGNGANCNAAFRSGSIIYVLVELSGGVGGWKVRRYNATTLAYIDEWSTGLSAANTDYAMSMCESGGNAIILYHDKSTGYITRRVMNKDTGALVTSETLGAASNLAGHIMSCYEGNADRGTIGIWLHTTAVPGAVLAFTPSAGSYIRNANFEFPTAYERTVSALVYDSTDALFKSEDAANGNWHSYAGAGHAWTTESSTWFITNTWRDSDATGGTHETLQGPPAVITMKRRAILNVTTPPIPTDPDNANRDDPNSVSIYVGRVDGVRTSQFRQATPADLVRTATLINVVFSNADTLHPNPPLAGDFPNLTPAVIQSEATDSFGPLTRINGSGVGNRWNGEFPDTDWIPYTPLTGTNYGGSEEPVAYRRFRGMLHLRGMVKDHASNTIIVQLPTGYRIVDPAGTPTRRQFGVLSSAGTSVVFIRDDGAIYTPLLGGAGTWINLADIPPQIIYG